MKASFYLSPILLLLAFFISLPTHAQVFFESVEPGEFSMCAFDEVTIRQDPGSTSRRVGRVLFGEELEHMGEQAFVRAENQVYLLVKAKDGTQGWVADNYLVKNGGLVAMLEDAPIYEKPNTLSSLTRLQLKGGELLIISDFKEEWMLLTSKRKERSGWVKGYEKVSTEDVDIEIASLLERANTYVDPNQRRVALQDISRTPNYNQARLAPYVDRLLQPQKNGALASLPATSVQPYTPTSNPATASPYVPQRSNVPAATTQPAAQPVFRNNSPTPATNTPSTKPAAQSIPYYSGVYLPPADQARPTSTSATRPTTPSPARPATTQPLATQPAAPASDIIIQDVVDMETGRTFQRIRESGTVQPVKGPKETTTIYFAYHKTLPKGTSIWLEMPGGQGMVKLEVVAPLRQDNPNMIGLGDEAIKALFGNKTGPQIGRVSILYPKN